MNSIRGRGVRVCACVRVRVGICPIGSAQWCITEVHAYVELVNMKEKA